MKVLNITRTRRSCDIFFVLYSTKFKKNGDLVIFRRFASIFRPKSKGHTNVFYHFPKFVEDCRRFPNIFRSYVYLRFQSPVQSPVLALDYAMRHGVQESLWRSLMRGPLYGYHYSLLHSRVGSQELLIEYLGQRPINHFHPSRASGAS